MWFDSYMYMKCTCTVKQNLLVIAHWWCSCFWYSHKTLGLGSPVLASFIRGPNAIRIAHDNNILFAIFWFLVLCSYSSVGLGCRKLRLFISFSFYVSIVCKRRRRAPEALTIISAAAADRASYTRLRYQLTPACFHSDRVDAALPSSTPTPIFSMGLLLLLSTRIVLLSYWCAVLKRSQ